MIVLRVRHVYGEEWEELVLGPQRVRRLQCDKPELVVLRNVHLETAFILAVPRNGHHVAAELGELVVRQVHLRKHRRYVQALGDTPTCELRTASRTPKRFSPRAHL